MDHLESFRRGMLEMLTVIKVSRLVLIGKPFIQEDTLNKYSGTPLFQPRTPLYTVELLYSNPLK